MPEHKRRDISISEAAAAGAFRGINDSILYLSLDGSRWRVYKKYANCCGENFNFLWRRKGDGRIDIARVLSSSKVFSKVIIPSGYEDGVVTLTGIDDSNILVSVESEKAIRGAI